MTHPMTIDPEALKAASKLADAVVLRVCEYDDRTSPEDWPEALLITPEELHAELMQFADALSRTVSPVGGKSPELTYAKELATVAASRYGPPPGWAPLDDMMGVLSQIDNALCGLIKGPDMFAR